MLGAPKESKIAHTTTKFLLQGMLGSSHTTQ